MRIRILKHEDGTRTVVVKPRQGSGLIARQARAADAQDAERVLGRLLEESRQERANLEASGAQGLP